MSSLVRIEHGALTFMPCILLSELIPHFLEVSDLKFLSHAPMILGLTECFLNNLRRQIPLKFYKIKIKIKK